MVTHSISEALLLSDRVLVLTPRPGWIGLNLPVDLPRPREEEVRYTEHFGSLARKLKAAIKVSLIAGARGKDPFTRRGL